LYNIAVFIINYLSVHFFNSLDALIIFYQNNFPLPPGATSYLCSDDVFTFARRGQDDLSLTSQQ